MVGELNLADGNAFTAAGFQILNLMEPVLAVLEGFYVKRVDDVWLLLPVLGARRATG